MNNEAKERCKYELFVEEYFGLIPEITNEETKVVTDYGQLVNLLTTFESKFKNSVGKPVVDTDSGLNIPDVTSRFLIGTEWFQSFGNGFRSDTIVEVINRYRVRLAGFGEITKIRLSKQWECKNDW